MTNGLPDFAEVTVRLTGSAVDRVTVELDPPSDGYPPARDWVGAAIIGAEQALTELGRLLPGRQRLSVTITQILGTVSDTRPQAVRCATGLVVWRALTGSEPEIVWGRHLHLVFPPTPREHRTAG